MRTEVGTAVQVPLECTDPDGDAVTLSIVDGPTKGSLGPIAGGEVTYTPDAGEFGADSFTFRATDGTADVRAGDRRRDDHAPAGLRGRRGDRAGRLERLGAR